MIFVDSNVPVYLVGAAHPNKTRSQGLLEAAITSGDRLVTDAEVMSFDADFDRAPWIVRIA